MVATVPISAFRWWVLLRGLAFRLSLTWSISTSFVSIFFSTFLPGAYGGDLVRLAIAVRAAGKGTLNRLTFSVIADRLAGLMALLILAVALVPLLPADLAERERGRQRQPDDPHDVRQWQRDAHVPALRQRRK